MRPWTRASLDHMLEAGRRAHRRRAGHTRPDTWTRRRKSTKHSIASFILICRAPAAPSRARRALSPFTPRSAASAALRCTTAFTWARRSSTITAAPIENGFNNYTGISGYASAGRFLVYARGEFQAAPSATGYSAAWRRHSPNVDDITFIDPTTGPALPPGDDSAGPD